jgi:hypothetical protein
VRLLTVRCQMVSPCRYTLCPQVQLKQFEIASSRKFLKAAAFSAVMGEGGQEAGDSKYVPKLLRCVLGCTWRSCGAGPRLSEMPNLADLNAVLVWSVLFVGALTGVWAGWGVVGVAQCCHRQLWQCQGAYEAAIRFSKPAPTRFPFLPHLQWRLLVNSTSCCCSGASRRWGRGRFGPLLCNFHLLALAFLPSGWGQAPLNSVVLDRATGTVLPRPLQLTVASARTK